MPTAFRSSIRVCAAAASSNGKVCPITGRIEPSAIRASACSVRRRRSAGPTRSSDADHAHLPLLGLVGSKFGEGAARGAVREEATALCGDLEGTPADLTAHPVEHDLDPGTTGRLADLGHPVWLGVVDQHVRAVLACQDQLVLAARGGDHLGSRGLREWHEPPAEAAGRGGHEHPLARPDVSALQAAQGGRPVVQSGDRRPQVHRVGYLEDVLEGCRVPLDVRTGVARPGHHATADPAWFDARADGGHGAGDTGAGHERRAQRKVVTSPPPPHLGVEEDHLDHLDVHDELAFFGHRILRLGGYEHLRAPEVGHFYDAHVAPSFS